MFYYFIITIIIFITAQISKLVSFRQALHQQLTSSESVLVLVVGIAVAILAYAAKVVCQNELLAELKKRREEKNAAKISNN